MLAATWGPEQWVLVITSVLGSLTAAVTAIIAALKAQQTANAVKLPSNSKTIGQAMEKVDQTQTLAVQTDIDHRKDNIATHDALLDAHAKMQTQLDELQKKIAP